MSSEVSPAPISRTRRAERSPRLRWASSTATEGIETPFSPDRGLGPGPLAGGEGAAEHPVEDRAGRALDQRQLVGALHLALDLGLADDHRVEPRGDPVEVPRRLGAAQRVERAEQLGGPDPGLAGEHPETGGLGLDRVGRHQVELGPVAGRERRGLADRLLGDERVEHPRGLALGEGELLAQRQRRRPVRDAEGEQAAHPRPPGARPRSRARGRGSGRRRARPRRRAGRSASSASEPSSRWIRGSFAAMIAT